jgi:hypothetical protein
MLPLECICVCVCVLGRGEGERVVMIFTVNGDYFPKHHWPIGFCNKLIVFLWSRNLVLEYYLQDFAADSVDGGGHEHSQTQCVSDLKCMENFWFTERLLVFCRVTLRLWAVTALTERLFIKNPHSATCFGCVKQSSGSLQLCKYQY